MLRITTACLGFLLLAASPAWAATAPDTQTIVLVRHGEKQSDGLGQLDCRGLNRSLALPKVIQGQFGKPDAIFAPDPAKAKPDHFTSYDYVRPLATVEPTAIRFGLPVNTHFGWSETHDVVAELEQPRYRTSLVLVAWEHLELVKAAYSLMADNGGDPSKVPAWHYDDYDGIYVIRITRGPDGTHASFERRVENLDGQSSECPGSQ